MTATEDEAPAAAVPPLAAFLRPQLPPAALHGLPGEVATTLAEATGADPAAVLVTFLALLGNAAGPQPHARFGGAEHPARLAAILLVDEALTEPHHLLRELAEAYRVPAVIPHSERAEDYRSLIQPEETIMTDAEIDRFFKENR